MRRNKPENVTKKNSGQLLVTGFWLLLTFRYSLSIFLRSSSFVLRPSSFVPRPSSFWLLAFGFWLLVCLSGGVVKGQNPLSLSQAIEIGFLNNFSIRIQRQEAAIAHNDNTIGNAGFLPEIGLTGTQNNTVSNTHQEQFSGTIKDISGAQNSTLNLGIQLNWTLFDGFQMFVNKKMLRVLEDLGENGTRLVVEGTVSDIIMNYYGILQLKKMVQVMQEAVDLSVQRKRIVAAMLTFGAGSELMLLQSTVDLNADSTRLIREELLLANALIDLNRVLATDIHTQWLISDSIRIKDTLAFDDILARAIRENATLAAARLNQELMRLEVKNSQAGRYPEIGLTAGYAYNTLNSQTGFLKYSQSYGPSYGIILSYELFNGFNLNRTIKNAKLALNAGEIETKDAEQELTATLRKLFNEYLMNLQIIRMQLVNVRLAQENVDIAFEKYKLGSLDDIGLRETQNKLIDAQSQLILAQYEAKKAETEIFRLSGYFSQQGP